MPTLLAFATDMERSGVFPNYPSGVPKNCDVLVSGIGILSTALSVSKALQNKKYERVIMLGVAGAYKSSGLSIGEVVNVEKECLIEFLPFEPNIFFSTAHTGASIKSVKSATVLQCAKTDEVGEIRGKIAEIENMEGAAFFAACNEFNVPSMQIRAISNFAEKYDKSKWQIPSALTALREFFISLPFDSSGRFMGYIVE